MLADDETRLFRSKSKQDFSSKVQKSAIRHREQRSGASVIWFRPISMSGGGNSYRYLFKVQQLGAARGELESAWEAKGLFLSFKRSQMAGKTQGPQFVNTHALLRAAPEWAAELLSK